MTKAKKPADDPVLSTEARALRQAIQNDYGIRDPTGLAVLDQLCHALDGIRACQRAIRSDGLMVRGSRGQMRAHPLIGAEEGYRRAFVQAVRTLRLDVSEPADV